MTPFHQLKGRHICLSCCDEPSHSGRITGFRVAISETSLLIALLRLAFEVIEFIERKFATLPAAHVDGDLFDPSRHSRGRTELRDRALRVARTWKSAIGCTWNPLIFRQHMGGAYCAMVKRTLRSFAVSAKVFCVHIWSSANAGSHGLSPILAPS